MNSFQREDWLKKRCKPCEGSPQPYSQEKAAELVQSFPEWRLQDEGKLIRCELLVKDFSAALELINAIGKVAEQEDHHPDIHLTSYRKLAIELSTHAAGGLTDNDFILASKIDELPKRLKIPSPLKKGAVG